MWQREGGGGGGWLMEVVAQTNPNSRGLVLLGLNCASKKLDSIRIYFAPKLDFPFTYPLPSPAVPMLLLLLLLLLLHLSTSPLPPPSSFWCFLFLCKQSNRIRNTTVYWATKLYSLRCTLYYVLRLTFYGLHTTPPRLMRSIQPRLDSV